jgi:hypothetical protein
MNRGHACCGQERDKIYGEGVIAYPPEVIELNLSPVARYPAQAGTCRTVENRSLGRRDPKSRQFHGHVSLETGVILLEQPDRRDFGNSESQFLHSAPGYIRWQHTRARIEAENLGQQ